MMGRRKRDQGRFSTSSGTKMHPQNHLPRRMNVFVAVALADLHKTLEPFYSDIGRPSVDPELIIRMLIVGYCYAFAPSAGFVRRSSCILPIAGFFRRALFVNSALALLDRQRAP
jgi:hypothetical protein